MRKINVRIRNHENNVLLQLNQNGALPFILQALRLDRTMEAFGSTPATYGHLQRLGAARERQELTHNQPTHMVTGIVCGERVTGFVTDDVLILNVAHEETRSILKLALSIATNPNARYFSGVTPRLVFQN